MPRRPARKLAELLLEEKTVLQHCTVPPLQLSRVERDAGAAETTEDKATTGKMREDARMNILIEMWGIGELANEG